MIGSGDALECRPQSGLPPRVSLDLAIPSQLGMRPLMERVLSRREILGA